MYFHMDFSFYQHETKTKISLITKEIHQQNTPINKYFI